MGSFGARDAIFPLTLRLEFIEPSTTIVHEPPLAWGRWHATASHRRHAARARLRAAWLLWPAYGRPCRTLRRLPAPNKSQDLGASAVFGKVGGENRAWRKDRTTRHDHPTGNKVCKATIATGGSIFSVCASHSPLEYLIVTISP